MSSLSTVRRGSSPEENPFKRQKISTEAYAMALVFGHNLAPALRRDQPLYVTEVVALLVEGKTVAHVPMIKFKETGAEGFLTEKFTVISDLIIHEADFHREEDDVEVVQMWAHWAQHNDVEAALDHASPATCPDDSEPEFLCDYEFAQIKFFFRVYSLAQKFTDCGNADFHDALIDFFREWIKGTVAVLDGVADEFTKMDRCLEMREEYEGNLPGRIHSLIAAILSYHEDQTTGKFSDLDKDIQNEMASYLRIGCQAGDFGRLPKDPLSPDFNDHCVYHLHGDKTCYRKKNKKESREG